MTIDLGRYRQLYVEESLEGLEAVESGLLRMGKEGPDGAVGGDAIHDIFRAIHSIKGGSGTFGLTNITGLSHVMETLLDEIRSSKRRATDECIELLLAGCDRLRQLLESTAAGESLINAGEITARLDGFLRATQAPSVGTASTTPEAARVPAQERSTVERAGWSIRFAPHPGMLQTANDPIRILRDLGRLGPLHVVADTSRLPSLESLDPELCYLSWTIELRAAATRELVAEAFSWVEGDCDLQLTPLGAEAPAAPPVATAEAAPTEAARTHTPATPATSATSAAPATRAGAHVGPASTAQGGADATSMRVAIDKVDALVNLVGELVITQSMLGQINKEIDPFTQQKLRKGLEQLERNTRELQESVMRIRMLPIKFAFNRYHRLVHDLSERLGKRVELHLAGEQTELDRTVLEKITDPLTHLVRNCLDHGIETPAARKAKGKPEAGRLFVSAEHRGGNIIIEVADDGAGIDRERVIRRARSLGLIGETEQVSEDQITELIFRPGFSTAEVISEVSGRGVGMDVVHRNIQLLGGSLQLRSVPGKGTTFTIRLPLTMAILEAQMVRVGGAVYIFPLVSIVESMQVRPAQVRRIANAVEVYPVRNEYLPILRLRELLRVDGESSAPREEGELLVLVEGDGQQVGLVVDDLLEQQQVVIKSLESNFQRVPGISGATILGDGTVALILDVGALIHMALQQGARHERGSRVAAGNAH